MKAVSNNVFHSYIYKIPQILFTCCTALKTVSSIGSMQLNSNLKKCLWHKQNPNDSSKNWKIRGRSQIHEAPYI